MPAANAADSDNDTIEDVLEKELAERFAPILYFEKEEKFFPVNVEYHLNNSNLNRSQDGDDLIDPDPTAENISQYNTTDGEWYLDNRLGTIDDDGIEKDYKAQEEELGYTIYARVTNQSHKGTEYYVVQYWIFYAFSKGPLNRHEGDWEMVQVVVGMDNKEPWRVAYSQHLDGQVTDWGLVETDGDHIKVYVARGSHANYFRSYQGKPSLANDEVGDNGKVLKPDDYTMVLLGEVYKDAHPADQNWLVYYGRWGEYGTEVDELFGKRGPYGPVLRDAVYMW